MVQMKENKVKKEGEQQTSAMTFMVLLQKGHKGL